MRRPSLLGINAHFASDRYRDDASHRYSPYTHDRNRWHRYADVDAVRALNEEGYGLQRMLEDTASRYGLPVAMTTSHLASTREQQMLWLQECWNAAQAARARGFEVRAVTAGALFGSLDWNAPSSTTAFHYESGAFDMRSPAPRATALVPMIRALSAQQQFDHPALDAEPCWNVPTRLTCPTRTEHENGRTAPRPVRRTAAPLVIVGARGTLGSALVRIAAERGLYVVAMTREELDITNPLMIREQIRELAPWGIINAAGWGDIDEAERQRERCHRVNVIGAEQLARAAAARRIPYCTFSSDLVFGQGSARPFLESDQPAPCNGYGRSQATAERRVLVAHEGALVVRTSGCFGDWDRVNFVTRTLHRLAAGEDVHAPDDAVVSPTYVPDLGHAVLDLLIDGASGLWHLANIGACSWFDLAKRSASMAGFDPHRVHACRGSDIGWTAPRPSFSVLGSERATLLRPLEDALARYIRTRAWEQISTRDSQCAVTGTTSSTPPTRRPGLLRDQA
jgi:dTDP-4-dehydrorhamnose reductase